MGEVRDDEENPAADWKVITSFAGSDGPLGEIAEAVRAAGPPPSGPSAVLRAPLIIDTDLGGDPDDAVAVVVAALRVPELALLITTDEVGGERARLARHLLDLAGRPEVPVVAGADLGGAAGGDADGRGTGLPGSVAGRAQRSPGPIRGDHGLDRDAGTHPGAVRRHLHPGDPDHR